MCLDCGENKDPVQGGNFFSAYWNKIFFIGSVHWQVCSSAALRLMCWRAVQQLPSNLSRGILSSLQDTSFVLLSQLALENGACLKIYLCYRLFTHTAEGCLCAVFIWFQIYLLVNVPIHLHRVLCPVSWRTLN